MPDEKPTTLQYPVRVSDDDGHTRIDFLPPFNGLPHVRLPTRHQALKAATTMLVTAVEGDIAAGAPVREVPAVDPEDSVMWLDTDITPPPAVPAAAESQTLTNAPAKSKGGKKAAGGDTTQP